MISIAASYAGPDPALTTADPCDTTAWIAVVSGRVVPARASRAYLKIVPVVLRGTRAELDTYALLAEGSTVTIIGSSVVDTLGLDAPNELMWVQSVSGIAIAHKESKRENVVIRDKHSADELQIRDAHTVAY